MLPASPAEPNYLVGDCAKVLKTIPDNSIDLVVTSPPYADSRKKIYGGVQPKDYVDWFLPIADELHRVLSPTGTFILNIKERVLDGQRHKYVIDLIYKLTERNPQWRWTEEYIWHKKNCYPGRWPNRFRDAWERLVQFNKEKHFKMRQDAVKVDMGKWAETRLQNLSQTDLVRDPSKVGSGFGKRVANWVGRDKVYPTNVIHSATETGNRNHSAVFPRKIPEFFIELFTDEGDLVLDPFAGSGTTLAVAYGLGRRSIGIDTQKEYKDSFDKYINSNKSNIAI